MIMVWFINERSCGDVKCYYHYSDNVELNFFTGVCVQSFTGTDISDRSQDHIDICVFFLYLLSSGNGDWVWWYYHIKIYLTWFKSNAIIKMLRQCGDESCRPRIGVFKTFVPTPPIHDQYRSKKFPKIFSKKSVAQFVHFCYSQFEATWLRRNPRIDVKTSVLTGNESCGGWTKGSLNPTASTRVPISQMDYCTVKGNLPELWKTRGALLLW